MKFKLQVRGKGSIFGFDQEILILLSIFYGLKNNFIEHESTTEYQIIELLLDGDITKLYQGSEKIVKERWEQSVLNEIAPLVVASGVLVAAQIGMLGVAAKNSWKDMMLMSHCKHNIYPFNYSSKG